MPLLLLLSFGSGLAALIYEIVWFQVLELVVGSSAVSLAVLLATFMGGTCLGSLLLPRLIPERYRPLKVYASIETGIALLAVLVLFVTPAIGSVYTAWAGYGLIGFLLRGAVAAICLLPPTLLMGATLPILSRQVQATREGISWMGFFYGANIGGAVCGCLVAGFYLLRKYDVATATYVAAAVNAAVAAMAVCVAETVLVSDPLPLRGCPPVSGGQYNSPPDTGGEPGAKRPAGGRSHANVHLAIALSGFCAMAAEAVWTRTLGLLFGASVYTLSIIVAVFLVGLGIGSTIGSLLCRTVTRPRMALGWCQLLAAAAIAWTAYSLNASLPYWPVNPSISSNIWVNLQIDLDRALWAVLPPALMWGASFPLALAAAGLNAQKPDRLMSAVYASNTAGAIAGALSASLLLVAWAGSQHTEQLLIGLSATAALLMLLPAVTRSRSIVLTAGAVLVAALLITSVPELSKLLIAQGRYASTWVGKGTVVYAREGLNSSVAVSDFPNGVRTFHVAGKIQASNVSRDMRLQRMLGHLTSLTPRSPRSVLVIGCGAGITAGAVSIDPRMERTTIVEIEPLVPQTASTYFAHENFEVIRNPRVQIHIDDGRHYLLTTGDRFDAITADPLDPWVKGAANLYTEEFLEAAKGHLNPGGVVTMYIQLFETNMEAVKSAVATFFKVFPNGTAWGNTYDGRGHDMILLGQVEPLRIDLDEAEQRLREPEYARVAASLDEVGMHSAVDLFATYAGRGSDLTEWLKSAAINRDRNLRMEYLAGAALDLDDSAAIYSDMLAYRRFPEDIFTGSAEKLSLLRWAMGLPN